MIQYDEHDFEDFGFEKFNLLRLRHLSIINMALKTVDKELVEHGENPIDIGRIPLNDPAVFKLLNRAKTTAIFQLESRGMKELIRALQPDCFHEIAALTALYRPGPFRCGMVDSFIERKHGRRKILYPDEAYQHESLKPILELTYGVILYEEQVMQMAQVLAGYTLRGADILRRALGKKKANELAQQRASFIDAATKKRLSGDLAKGIFELMLKYRVHTISKAYIDPDAQITYRALWLKANHSEAYMDAAALLSH